MPGAPLSHLRQHEVTAIFAWCYACSRGEELDLDMLIERLGPDLPVPDVAKHLRCSRCGGKTVQTRPAWPRRMPEGR